MNLTISVDTKKVQQDLNRLAEGVRDKAVARALNKAAKQAKTAAGREIKQRYSLSTRVFNKTVTMKKANKNSVEVIMRVEGKPFPIMGFRARQNKTGVSFVLGGRRVMVRHAFMATMASGHKGVFARGGYQKTTGVIETGETWGRHGAFRYGSLRTPITELKTFSAPYAFMNKAVQRELKLKIYEQFPKLLDHEIKWELSK